VVVFSGWAPAGWKGALGANGPRGDSQSLISPVKNVVGQSNLINHRNVYSSNRRRLCLQVGLPLGGTAPVVPMGRVVGRELEILGSHGLDASDMPAILQLVAERKLNVRALVAREVSLAEGAAALEAMDHGSSVGIVMVTSFE